MSESADNAAVKALDTRIATLKAMPSVAEEVLAELSEAAKLLAKCGEEKKELQAELDMAQRAISRLQQIIRGNREEEIDVEEMERQAEENGLMAAALEAQSLRLEVEELKRERDGFLAWYLQDSHGDSGAQAPLPAAAASTSRKRRAEAESIETNSRSKRQSFPPQRNNSHGANAESLPHGTHVARTKDIGHGLEGTSGPEEMPLQIAARAESKVASNWDPVVKGVSPGNSGPSQVRCGRQDSVRSSHSRRAVGFPASPAV